MSDELGGLFRDREAELESQSEGRALDDVARARVLGRARRTRRARAALTGVAAAVAVVLVAGGVLLLARPPVVPPVEVPTVSPSPSPTHAPSPTEPTAPAPTSQALPAPAFAGTVTVSDELPTAQPITPQVWAEAGSGWVLASYRETWLKEAPASPGTYADAGGPEVVYLVSPDGDRYQLVEPETNSTVAVVAWQPQDTTALVAVRDTYLNAPWSWARLDLVSGRLSPVTVDAAVPWVGSALPPLADGRVPIEDASTGQATRAVAADGTVSDITPIEAPAALAAASAAYLGASCAVSGRYDAASVLISCTRSAEAAGNVMWHRDVLLRGWQDGRVEVLGDSADTDVLTSWSRPTVVSGKVLVSGIAFTGSDSVIVDCPTGRYVLGARGLTILPGVAAADWPSASIFRDAGASGTSTYTYVTGGCSSDAQPATLVRDDLETGAHAELFPYPADASPGNYPWESLTGYYVVP